MNCRKRTDVREHPLLTKKGRIKMERTYVFNTVFKIMAALGFVSLLGLAGSSDLGEISTAKLFLQGGISVICAGIGVWGAVNCSRIIDAEKKRLRRLKRVASSRNLPDAA